MESGYITLSKKQQRGAGVLNRVSSGKMTKAEAEGLLELSRRQLNRVLVGYQVEGLRSLASALCAADQQFSTILHVVVLAAAG